MLLKVQFPLLLLSLVFTTCQASQPLQSSDDAIKIARKALGEKVVIQYNESNTYALFQQAVDIPMAEQVVKFVVLRLSDNKIVYEGQFIKGYVKWIAERTLELFAPPGKVQAEDNLRQYSKQINVEP